MAIIIRDVKVYSMWDIELRGTAGVVRLKGKTAILTAIGHTGYEHFNDYREKSLRFFLAGRYAYIEKKGLDTPETFLDMIKDKRLFTIRFRVQKITAENDGKKVLGGRPDIIKQRTRKAMR